MAQIVRFLILLLVLLSCFGCHAEADQVDFAVLDEKGEAIPFATVWSAESTQLNDIGAMQRVVDRLSSDADLVFSAEEMPSLLVTHANQSGEVTLEATNPGSTLIVAIIKRGYSPKVFKVSDGTRVSLSSSTRGNRPDNKLFEFDRLRAQSESRDVSESRRAVNELRDLAGDLEVTNRLSDAAIVYYTLAHSLTYELPGEGSGEGYVAGFDEANPQKVSDRKKAFELGNSNPHLRYEQFLVDWQAKGYLNYSRAGNEKNLLQFVRITEDYLSRNVDHRPWAYVELWQAYEAMNKPNDACHAIRRFYVEEPAYYEKQEWSLLVKLFESTAGQTCELGKTVN
jgi:hypothetical protein